jgi:GMP synthase (glutamine-hydrolysing)
MPQKVLLVVHQEHSDPGRVAAELARRGCECDLRRTACGDPLPATMAEHAGVVIFGGPMSANDDSVLPFIRMELEWLAVPLGEGKPFLGICLGAQLLARYLGAKVGPHAGGYNEIGYYRVAAAGNGAGLFQNEQYFYQWHGEGFEVPCSAELLATGEYFPNQAFRYGNAYGIQFHPEVTKTMMLRWTRRAAHRMTLQGAQAREAHLKGHEQHDAEVERWLVNFLECWLQPASDNGAVAQRAAAG